MSNERYKTVLLFGAPGAGKGTQGKILGTIPGFFHHACGDVFRSLDIRSELGRTFYEYSSRGQLVPADVTVGIWHDSAHARTMTHEYKPDQDLLILDGIPRSAEQAVLMEKYIDVLKIVHLVCTDEAAMMQRLRRRALKENRHDDADEKVIRRRWEVYEAETRPVLDHYDPAIIEQADAVASPAQVLRRILEIVIPIQDAHFSHYKG